MTQDINLSMSSNKPYLIRAMYEWISDNELTPFIYVDVFISGVVLPEDLMHATPQVFNISATACQNLFISNDSVIFQARFSGKVFDVFIPIGAVMGIVATENGQGMTFDTSDVMDEVNESIDNNDVSSSDDSTPSHKAKKKSSLKIIK